ncbi:DUF6302 family protein [Streptomyces sp. JV176]|uniref:DUF6302 family protein n=1 Tax=Streptomyces sp. JV176 TaxID=858630 RepID=UPI002E78A189|nr:DUF6302 family protein [Streptomyces sp. JV176]
MKEIFEWERMKMRGVLRDPELLDDAVVIKVSRGTHDAPVQRLAVPIGASRLSGAMRLRDFNEAMNAMWELSGRSGFPNIRLHRPCSCCRGYVPALVMWGQNMSLEDPEASARLLGYSEQASTDGIFGLPLPPEYVTEAAPYTSPEQPRQIFCVNDNK